jgi:hypothetical protein
LPGTREDAACKSTHEVGLPYRFRMLKNRLLRKLFRSKGTGAMGRWRKLYVEELHGLYSLSNIIKVIRLSTRRPLGRPRRRWKDNIWVFRKWEGIVGTGWSGLRIGTGGGHL